MFLQKLKEPIKLKEQKEADEQKLKEQKEEEPIEFKGLLNKINKLAAKK